MSEKIVKSRRGFLARMLQGAAAATVATGTVLEVTENKAGAATVKEVEQETGEISFFNRNKWKSWDDLLEKLQTHPAEMTDYELYQLSQYMLRSRNATKIMRTYSNLQRNQRALVKIHPLVNNMIVFIATGKEIPGHKEYENMPDWTRDGISRHNLADNRDLLKNPWS